MQRHVTFNYYVPTNEDIYAVCKDWKLSFDNCRAVWERIAQGIMETWGATNYKLKSFLVPRFEFKKNPPDTWHKNQDGLYTPTPQVARAAFHGLPVPENFTRVCVEMGFPDIIESNLKYWLIWTPMGKLILSVPNDELLLSKDVVFSPEQKAFFSDNFTQVSEARYKYWISKEFLVLGGETPE